MKIEINLLPGAKKKRGGGFGLEIPDVRELVAQIKDPLLLAAVGLWVVSLGFMGSVFMMENGRAASLEPTRDQIRREARNFRAAIAEKVRTQVLRDSLVAELDAIREIDGDRLVWPHILEEVSLALPDFTWIVSLRAVTGQEVVLDDGTLVPGPTAFSIDGRTANMQAFTRFLSQLEASPWITDVRAGPTQSVVENDRQVNAFEITATFTTADSSFIRVVPIDQVFGRGG